VASAFPRYPGIIVTRRPERIKGAVSSDAQARYAVLQGWSAKIQQQPERKTPKPEVGEKLRWWMGFGGSTAFTSMTRLLSTTISIV
jgi:hypothetical protein